MPCNTAPANCIVTSERHVRARGKDTPKAYAVCGSGAGVSPVARAVVWGVRRGRPSGVAGDPGDNPAPPSLRGFLKGRSGVSYTSVIPCRGPDGSRCPRYRKGVSPAPKCTAGLRVNMGHRIGQSPGC